MLPGFRFLFAAIALSMSILVFGLGAAALLRAAHEEFASTPSWHAPPETMFAQPRETTSEASGPVLAMLRIEPPATEQRTLDNIPAVAAPAEQAAIVSTPLERATIAVPRSEDASLPETAKPETAKPEVPVAESPAQDEAAPAQADAPVPAGDTKIAANETILSPPNETPSNEAAPIASAQMSAPASTKIATLGGPPVTVETQPSVKASSAKPDTSAIKKRAQARQAIQRRKIALRARVARQALEQQPTDPFAQPVTQPVTAARKR